MSELKNDQCVPCRGDLPALDKEGIAALMAQVPGWQVETVEGVARLVKRYRFPNFRLALAFTLAVGELAESQNHHPVLVTEWGQVTVSWWTHAIGGLHQNDFIMAARTDCLEECPSG